MTPSDPEQRGCQLSLKFNIDISLVYEELIRRGVAVCLVLIIYLVEEKNFLHGYSFAVFLNMKDGPFLAKWSRDFLFSRLINDILM